MARTDHGLPGVYNGTPITLPSGSGAALALDANGQLLSSPGTTDTPGLIVGSTDFWPVYNRRDLGDGILRTDPAGALMTNGAVSNDQGTGRANFTGTSIFITPGPTATFINGSQTVTGSGFTSLDLHYLDYIKLNSDTNTAWAQISFIESDTAITLLTNYSGTGGTGIYNYSQVSSSTGTGQTISVASGQATIALGATTAAQANITKANNSGETIQFITSLSISQRVANQNIYVGLESVLTGPKQFARFNFQGTDNTQVITETGYNPTAAPSASEMETNTITFSNGGNSSTLHTYRIEHIHEKCFFYIDDVLVATHTKRIMHISTIGSSFIDDGGTAILSAGIRGLNGTTPTTGTSIVLDYIQSKSHGRLDTYQALPVYTTPYIPGASPLTGQSGNVANANAVATLTSATGRTAYITGFQLTASGATAGADVNVTITGLISGTLTYTFTFPLGAVVPAQPLIVPFPTPIPASATATNIVVTLPAGGVGNTNASANAQGFLL